MTEEQKREILQLIRENMPDHTHENDKIQHSNLLGLGTHGEYIQRDGSVDFTGEQSMGTNKLTNVTDPAADQDAATKKYVDDEVSGLVTPKVEFEVSTLFEDVARFTTFDEASGAVSTGGLNLTAPSANRTQGYEIENNSAFKVFGDGNTVEMSTLVTVSGNAPQRNTSAYVVVGDLTGGAAPTITNNHFGFYVQTIAAGSQLVISTSSANGTSHNTGTGFASANGTWALKAIYNGTNVKFYVDGALVATHTTYVPTVDAAGHFGTFIITSPGTDDAGNYPNIIVGSFNYKAYNQ